jgi:hypothetical protein
LWWSFGVGGCLIFIFSQFADMSFQNQNKWLRCVVVRAPPVLWVMFLAGYMGMGVVVFKLGLGGYVLVLRR